MKIIFAHSGREHLGVGYLSAALREAGHDTELAIDIGIFGQNDNIIYSPRLRNYFNPIDAIVRKIVKYQPDAVCLTAYTSTLQWCFDVASRVKALMDVPTIIGGVHITLCPESALTNPHIDYGVRGEAENLIADIINGIKTRGALKNIPGLIYRDGEKVTINPPAPIEQNIDRLPLPDKDIFRRAINISDDYMTLTTRGCAYNCTYCCEAFFKKLYQGQKFRRVRSVDSLIEELCVMDARYHFKKAHFACSMFPPEKEWVSDFADKYAKKIGKPFWCFGHINSFDLEYASLLRKAGCHNVNFGLQSVNESARSGLLGRNETNEKVAEALRICDAAGLNYDVDIMFHLPGENEEDYRKTVNFFLDFKRIHRIKLYNITLFPGTIMTERALERGYITKEELNLISQGIIGDYFHIPMTESKSSIEPWKVNAYRNTLRLLPILPKGMILLIMRPDIFKILGSLPGNLFKFIEMLRLIANKDQRLTFYLKMYARHIFHRLIGKQIV